MSERFDHYLAWRCLLEDPHVELDLSCSGLRTEHLAARREGIDAALLAMARLEAGAIANPDEDRRVGHYWLRAPGLAPDPALGDSIVEMVGSVEAFARAVHAGTIRSPEGLPFEKLILCGIGGSALGPMLLADLFGGTAAPLRSFVIDNTDPDGIERMLQAAGDLRSALCLVISKSGGTPETRNGMAEVRRACTAAGLTFPGRAVAVTGAGSALAERATAEGWLASFPMWDWVGGRTSLFSAVGLLPAVLQGVDVRALLAGAAAMDACTRDRDVAANPAAMLALYWHVEGEGRGARDMVVLPYKDRLLLFSRYLQQLVMESLGKELDRQGRPVHQGLSVYGNKGSTDQHAFVQQLRDGLHNFFCVFVRVIEDRSGPDLEVEPGVTTGDYLDGFWQGTRSALAENGRTSVTLTLQQLDARSVGALIALFERAVGLYAELIDVNAYHQPGVEAGKRAAAAVLAMQRSVFEKLDAQPQTAVALAAAIGADPYDVWPVLCHLAGNRPDVHGSDLGRPDAARFCRLDPP